MVKNENNYKRNESKIVLFVYEKSLINNVRMDNLNSI